jgi:hypothetical protein
MILRAIIYGAVIVASYLLGWHFHVDYSIGDFKNFTDSLLAVAGMVFTLMGIWIAIIYPNALQRFVNPSTVASADFTADLSDTRRLEALVAGVLKSALAVMFVLITYMLKFVLSKTQIYSDHIASLKWAALSLAVALSILQLEAIFRVAVANIMFINDLHSKRRERQVDNSY